jgi:hypothetical protein
MKDIVCSQITEVKGEVARRKCAERNWFTSSSHTMYALVGLRLHLNMIGSVGHG